MRKKDIQVLTIVFFAEKHSNFYYLMLTVVLLFEKTQSLCWSNEVSISSTLYVRIFCTNVVFSKYSLLEKTMFVRKICTYNVYEIDYSPRNANGISMFGKETLWERIYLIFYVTHHEIKELLEQRSPTIVQK